MSTYQAPPCERIDFLVAERAATLDRARRAIYFHDEIAEAKALIHLWAVEEQLETAADELDDVLRDGTTDAKRKAGQ